MCVAVGAAWYWLRCPAFSRLMSHYNRYLARVDVTRGRSVPCPAVPGSRPVQVLPALNPYTARYP